MKLHAVIGDHRHEVEIKRDGEKLFARVDDREYELDVSEPEPGVFLFKHEGRIYEATLSTGDPTHVRIGTDEFDVRVIDPKRLRGSSGPGEHADGIAEIRTAMPGKVVRVILEAGTEVSKGDGVLVVEAMKMQNELKSPKNGTIKEVRVAEGATVAAGDILATIE
jgi:biotin carboxyl carrier protein